jgi:hypothetical protein
MNFIPLKAEHVAKLGPLEPIHGGYEVTPEMAVTLEELGGTAAVDDDGSVVGIAGILPRWDGVGLAWVWLSRSWRKHARAITDEVKRTVEGAPYHRIEMGVKLGYDRGEAWARRLGFCLETPLARKWGPDGSDYSIWVRCK